MNNQNPEPLAETSVSSPEREEKLVIASNSRIVERVFIASYTAPQDAGVLARGLFFRSIHDTPESAEQVRQLGLADFTVTEYVQPSSLSTEPRPERDKDFNEEIHKASLKCRCMKEGKNPCATCMKAWHQAWDLAEGKIKRVPSSVSSPERDKLAEKYILISEGEGASSAVVDDLSEGLHEFVCGCGYSLADCVNGSTDTPDMLEEMKSDDSWSFDEAGRRHSYSFQGYCYSISVTILRVPSSLSTEPDTARWIAVEQKMPGYMEEVLVLTCEDEVRCAHLEREDHGDSAGKMELDFWYSSIADQEIYHVTHWRPKLAPPGAPETAPIETESAASPTVEEIASYIESDSECLMEIVVEETRKQYGVRLLKSMANEIRTKFAPKGGS